MTRIERKCYLRSVDGLLSFKMRITADYPDYYVAYNDTCCSSFILINHTTTCCSRCH